MCSASLEKIPERRQRRAVAPPLRQLRPVEAEQRMREVPWELPKLELNRDLREHQRLNSALASC